MNREIAWEKWYDFVEKEETQELDDEKEEFFEEDEFEEDDFMNMPFSIISHPKKIRTPIGTYEADEPLSPSNMYDCWICHTNFKLIDRDIETLNSINGIEVIKIMSYHRFFIGIGKLFKFKEVQNEIKEKLCNVSEDEIKEQINLDTNKNFSIFVSEEGETHKVLRSDFKSELEYEEAVNKIKDMKNGTFITSKEV